MPSPSICMSTVYMSRTLPLLLLLHYIDQTLSERIFISFFTARATLFPLLIVITGKNSKIVFLFSLLLDWTGIMMIMQWKLILLLEKIRNCKVEKIYCFNFRANLLHKKTSKLLKWKFFPPSYVAWFWNLLHNDNNKLMNIYDK